MDREAPVGHRVPRGVGRGTPLDVLLRRGVRPERAIGQLGELLGAIHAVTVDGFGYLRPDGRGWPITLASIMVDLVEHRERLREAASHWRVEDRLVDSGLDALTRHADLYRYDDPRLLHGDLGPDHVLVDGAPGHERVSGIIDMQDCGSGHPAGDIALWLANSAHQVPLAALLASYPGGTGFAERHATLIALMMLRRALWMLIADQDRGNPSRIGDHVRVITAALASATVDHRERGSLD